MDDGLVFTRILLHAPYGSLPLLAEKIRRYGDDLTSDGNLPNPWVANLQRIVRAALEALWTDTDPLPEDSELHWWQLWIRRFPPNNIIEFEHFARAADVQVKLERLNLPEHIVVIARASRAQLESSLDLLNTLAEVRSARSCHYELSDLAGDEQYEWVDAALTRITLPRDTAPAVCVLDTGINRGHPFLSPLLAASDNHTIFPGGDSSDSLSGTGHGTLMAGLAAYGDLRNFTLTGAPWIQNHKLEGVKIIDPNLPHEPENYGAVTIQGVLTPETVAPHRQRVYSMAITATGDTDGRPSAWSAAIDSVSFGAEEQGEPKRLILISAGNVHPFDIGLGFRYPQENLECPIEDPAQAWNAVTVGALTHRDRILESDPESHLLKPLALDGGLSPFSRTSIQWDRHWPIKPEIVMEGGNAGAHPQNGPERRDSLEVLSTSAGFRNKPIAPVRATSAATALAAHLAAEIQASYPDLWPETIRGLLVHSARWNNAMLDGIDPHQPFTVEQRQRFIRLLQIYGFGEPDVSRARFSSQQNVTMLRQDIMTPYRGSAGSASVNDCHLHRLNLPTQRLQDLSASTCIMRVTLSYFTAPNPSSSNRIPGSRYRYGGCLLRFRVRHKDESEEEFIRQVSKEASDDDNGSPESATSLHDKAWALGHQLRGKAGSIVQDVWRGNAADIASMDHIAVFPVKGWWASKSFMKGSPWYRCHLRPVRYSLIVSLEVMADIQLYTEINNLISISPTT